MNGSGRILIVDVPGWQGGAAGNRPYPNVGIAYLLPMLERAGFSVMVFDMNNMTATDDDLVAVVAEFGPHIIGFSVKTATAWSARRLGTFLKGRYPEIPIIVGGPHATVAGSEMIRESWIDVAVLGEAEDTFPVLCHSLIQGGMPVILPGVIRKSDPNPTALFPTLVNDLDSLPFPDYSRFSSGVQETIASGYPLVTSRGCVYRCIYCSVPKISGNQLRKRSLVLIMDELRHAKTTYNISSFEIVDDAFNVDMKRTKQFCRMLIEAQLDLRWSCPNGLRADRVDPELADLMARSGCYSVMVGIESADPGVLATVKKGESIQDIERGIRIFQKAGISVGGYFIIGLPEDSYGSQMTSVRFAQKMGIYAHFNMLVPYPKTELWTWMKSNARLLQDIETTMHFCDCPDKVIPVLETDSFPSDERIRAYEMVHTRLGQFHMLLPRNLSQFNYTQRLIVLVWKYDRKNLIKRMLKEIARYFR